MDREGSVWACESLFVHAPCSVLFSILKSFASNFLPYYRMFHEVNRDRHRHRVESDPATQPKPPSYIVFYK
jgi:hypothetical protein